MPEPVVNPKSNPELAVQGEGATAHLLPKVSREIIFYCDTSSSALLDPERITEDSGVSVRNLEGPKRAENVVKALQRFAPFQPLTTDLGLGPILDVHSPSYIQYLKDPEVGRPDLSRALEEGGAAFASEARIRFNTPETDPVKKLRSPEVEFALDDFTPITRDTWAAAYGSAQCALQGAQTLLSGGDLVYALCRPPGHHAGTDSYGGFCYLNNAAIAARYLSKSGRVAILDIDVHHGNGTQEIFYEDPSVMYCSLHGDPKFAYPGTGHAEETGAGEAIGTKVNFPLPQGTDDALYIATLQKALDRIGDFKPAFLVISLGLDIADGDPYGYFKISNDGLRRIGEMIGAAGIPTLLIQEGGYQVGKIGELLCAFLGGVTLRGFPNIEPPA